MVCLWLPSCSAAIGGASGSLRAGRVPAGHLLPQTFDHLPGVALQQTTKDELRNVERWLGRQLVRNGGAARGCREPPRSLVAAEAAAATVTEADEALFLLHLQDQVHALREHQQARDSFLLDDRAAVLTLHDDALGDI